MSARCSSNGVTAPLRTVGDLPRRSVTCNMGPCQLRRRSPAPRLASVTIARDFGHRGSVRSRSGFRMCDRRTLRTRLTVSRLPSPAASALPTTRPSSTRSAPTGEAQRNLDRGGRKWLRRQAAARGDRSRRQIRRNGLGDGVRIHNRPHRCAAHQAHCRTGRHQRAAGKVQSHGRQDHHGSALEARRSHWPTQRRRHGAPGTRRTGLLWPGGLTSAYLVVLGPVLGVVRRERCAKPLARRGTGLRCAAGLSSTVAKSGSFGAMSLGEAARGRPLLDCPAPGDRPHVSCAGFWLGDDAFERVAGICGRRASRSPLRECRASPGAGLCRSRTYALVWHDP